MIATTKLYRPVGPQELELIRASGFRRFPARLPEQPIFYPVVQEEYARKIARGWNVKDSKAGYVTRFAVQTDYLSRYEEQLAGGRDHTEYWIPAEKLDEFNNHIVGRIELLEEFSIGDWVVAYDLATDPETISLGAASNPDHQGLRRGPGGRPIRERRVVVSYRRWSHPQARSQWRDFSSFHHRTRGLGRVRARQSRQQDNLDPRGRSDSIRRGQRGKD